LPIRRWGKKKKRERRREGGGKGGKKWRENDGLTSIGAPRIESPGKSQSVLNRPSSCLTKGKKERKKRGEGGGDASVLPDFTAAITAVIPSSPTNIGKRRGKEKGREEGKGGGGKVFRILLDTESGTLSSFIATAALCLLL